MQPVQDIKNLTLAPGELSFDFPFAGSEQRVWLRGGEVTPPADPALAMSLMPAMVEGGSLRVGGEISPRVLRMQAEFQAIQAAWSRHWPYERPPLREVEVEAGTREIPTPRQGRVATFFSGGVDSWATVLSEPEVTDLIFVRGLDIVPAIATQHQGLSERVEPILCEMAEDLGQPLHVLETNIREMTEPMFDWHHVHGAALAAIGLYFESQFERVLIPTDVAHASPTFAGACYMVDGLWSSEAVEIVDHGSRIGRFERTRLLAGDPRARASLRVCYENPGGAYNCGRCRKCLVTMIALEALGVRSEFPTFPPELDYSPLEGFNPANRLHQVIWIDCLQGVKDCGREDLAQIVAKVVERGEGHLADPALREAQSEADEARAEAAAAQAQLSDVLNSTSWRLTAPLRQLRGKWAPEREALRRDTPGEG